MGEWGVAMTLFHPVWATANPAAAPSPDELRRGAEAVAKAKAMGAPTAVLIVLVVLKTGIDLRAHVAERRKLGAVSAA
jgi:hypothetical protein